MGRIFDQATRKTDNNLAPQRSTFGRVDPPERRSPSSAIVAAVVPRMPLRERVASWIGDRGWIRISCGLIKSKPLKLILFQSYLHVFGLRVG